MNILHGERSSYRVIKQVGSTSTCRLYLCLQQEESRECLLQVPADAGMNGKLDHTAYILDLLRNKSNEIEEEYRSATGGRNPPLNYDISFPELVESFVCADQGERRMNIYGFRGDVRTVDQMVPIRHITDRDHRRVDVRTSAWIIGKLLKLFVFTHSNGIANRLVNGVNILIQPNQHYVLLFSWDEATVCSDGMPSQFKSDEIARAAQCVITLLGGDHQKRTFPSDIGSEMNLYIDFLLSLSQWRFVDAQEAHTRFYEIVDHYWDKSFYPFTTLPLDP